MSYTDKKVVSLVAIIEGVKLSDKERDKEVESGDVSVRALVIDDDMDEEKVTEEDASVDVNEFVRDKESVNNEILDKYTSVVVNVPLKDKTTVENTLEDEKMLEKRSIDGKASKDEDTQEESVKVKPLEQLKELVDKRLKDFEIK